MADAAPRLVQAIPDLVFSEDTAWSFKLPAGAFIDDDSPTLSYSAALVGGGALPSWLHFRAATQTFSGAPPQNFNGSVDIAVTASDGTQSASGRFRVTVLPVNDPVVLAMPIPDRDAVSNGPFTFRLPDGTFSDPDSTLTYSTTLTGGGALPGWLTFTPATQTFQGTPPANFTGALDIMVVASDGPTTASDSFTLRIRHTDAAPAIVTPISDQTIDEDTAWSFTVPAGTFSDPDSSGLVYRVNWAGLPFQDWIKFDPLTRTFTGTPPKDFNGTIELAVSADDGTRVATAPFMLTVRPVNDAPVVSHPLPDQTSQEDLPFSFQLPAGSFTDPESSALQYTATRLNGAALPAWLHFDAQTQTFSGTPPKDFNGSLSLKVAASDGTLSNSDTFVFTVDPVNDAPVLAKPVPDLQIDGGVAFSYAVQPGTFKDVDNATLIYTAQRTNGAALPTWLHFDPATQTFSGTPPKNFDGVLQVQVTASDGVSSRSDTLAFTHSAPVLDHPIDDQTVGDNKSWVFTVPADTFKDFDTPNLTWSATLADGSPLPSWLAFDAVTHTFRGTPPATWNGHEKLRVTANDGTHSTSDTFGLAQKGDFSFHIKGSIWGRNAPSELHFRYDDLYFQSSNSWQTGFSEGFSSGPVYGGISGSVGFAYDLQAGLLADLTLKPSTFDLQESFDIDKNFSTFTPGQLPSVRVLGEVETSTAFKAVAATQGMALQAFAGITATASAFIKAGAYAGISFPGFDIPLVGHVGVPDLTVGADLDVPVTFPGIDKIEIGNGDIKVPDNTAIGAIAVDMTSDDPPIVKTFEDGIGTISLKLPGGVDVDGYQIDPSFNGLGTLTAGGTADPFISATLDLDQLAIKAVPELEPLFHDKLEYDFGPFFAKATIDSDFALVGDLSMKETYAFTPQIYYTMKTSFGQTITGQAGDKTLFTPPEGEGSFKVNAQYHAEADLTTAVYLHGTIHFDFALLKTVLEAGVGYGPISFDFANIDLGALYQNSLSIGLDIPIYSNTDHYVLGTVRKETFSVPYEIFRTVQGSGNNLTLTTHQISLDGNDAANKVVGNAFDNIINGNGGADTLGGAAGNDALSGGDGNDQLAGGAGDDTLDGGAGNDTLDGGTGIDTATYASASAGVTVNLTLAVAQNTGGAGKDKLIGIENIVGSGFADALTGDGNANQIMGGAGDDKIGAGAGDDVLDGGDGIDTLSYASVTGGVTVSLAISGQQNTGAAGGNDTLSGFENLIGTAFKDTLTGDAGSNVLTGGAGDDTLIGGEGDDLLVGGAGSDTASYAGATAGVSVDLTITFDQDTGGAGFDTLISIQNIIGSGNDDTLTGDANANVLSGKAGNDVLDGGAGDDRLTGGGGFDLLTGGLGNDTFVFDQALNGNNFATVADFAAGSDKIALSHAIFSAAGAVGMLSANAFFAGSAAHDSDDRLLYNPTNGKLRYDADGTGAGGALVFAILSPGLSLNASDFQLV